MDAAVEAYLNGTLTSAGATCDHHDHEEGHSCGGTAEAMRKRRAPAAVPAEPAAADAVHRLRSMEGKNVGKTCRTHYREEPSTMEPSLILSYDRGEPLEFICGVGQMIRGFDATVAEMEVGEKVNHPSDAGGGLRNAGSERNFHRCDRTASGEQRK